MQTFRWTDWSDWSDWSGVFSILIACAGVEVKIGKKVDHPDHLDHVGRLDIP